MNIADNPTNVQLPGVYKTEEIPRVPIICTGNDFPGQSIDFFGALRARVYDDMVKDFCANIGIENLGKRLVNSKDGDVPFDTPNMSLDNLLEYGNLLVGEQENVKRVQLADSYLDGAELAGVGGSSMPEKI